MIIYFMKIRGVYRRPLISYKNFNLIEILLENNLQRVIKREIIQAVVIVTEQENIIKK